MHFSHDGHSQLRTMADGIYTRCGWMASSNWTCLGSCSVLCETTTQSQTKDRKLIEYKFVSKFELFMFKRIILTTRCNSMKHEIPYWCTFHTMATRSFARCPTEFIRDVDEWLAVSVELLVLTERVYVRVLCCVKLRHSPKQRTGNKSSINSRISSRCSCSRELF